MALIEALAAIVGPGHVAAGECCADWRGLFSGQSLAVVHPASTAEVAACVAACAQAGAAIVPLGGNTGLCGGATPRGGEVVIGLARLNRVRDLNDTDMVMVAEAGLTLQAARAAALAAGLDLPIRLASEGSAQIGGLIATNAGGNATLRFGNMRDRVLGLEVVLGDGTIWHGLRRLRKDNTGYALRQLFIGAEGTLGIVTAACLALVPAPPPSEVAMVALADVAAAVQLLGRMRRANSAGLHAFEYISGTAMRLALADGSGSADPFTAPALAYALIEFAGPRALLEGVLAAALQDGLAQDAVVAASQAQSAALWRLREGQAEAQARAGASVKNDISVPISAIAEFVARASAACTALLPGVRVADFGHIGDGNLHFNLVQPDDGGPAALLARAPELMATVAEIAHALGGSFSAEHGVGQLKTALLGEWRGGSEMAMMRAVKRALDPAELFNPGKLFGPAAPEG